MHVAMKAVGRDRKPWLAVVVKTCINQYINRITEGGSVLFQTFLITSPQYPARNPYCLLCNPYTASSWTKSRSSSIESRKRGGSPQRVPARRAAAAGGDVRKAGVARYPDRSSPEISSLRLMTQSRKEAFPRTAVTLFKATLPPLRATRILSTYPLTLLNLLHLHLLVCYSTLLHACHPHAC